MASSEASLCQVSELLAEVETLATEEPTLGGWKRLTLKALLDSSIGKIFFTYTFVVGTELIEAEKYVRAKAYFFHPGLVSAHYKDKDACIYAASTVASFEKLGVGLTQPFVSTVLNFHEANVKKNLDKFILDHYNNAHDLLTHLITYIDSQLQKLDYSKSVRYLELKRLSKEFEERDKFALVLYSFAFASAEFMDCSGPEPVISKVSPDSFMQMHQEVIDSAISAPNFKMDGKPLFDLKLYSASYYEAEFAKFGTTSSSPRRIDSLRMLKEVCVDTLDWFAREKRRMTGGGSAPEPPGGRARSQPRKQKQRDGSPDAADADAHGDDALPPPAKRQSTGARAYVVQSQTVVGDVGHRTTCAWNHQTNRRCAARFKSEDAIKWCECTGGDECQSPKGHAGNRCHQAYHKEHVPEGSADESAVFWCLPCRTGCVYQTN